MKSSMGTSFEELRTDPEYKRYIAAIDKILISFDSITEWPDMINFQSKLAKTLLQFDTYTTIPHKHRIAKRLAQCLNPTLPSGVHQKTLETYKIIFHIIGSNLCKDLSLYSLGIFPFLQNASLSIKPLVFNIYETYFLSLDLTECINAFILAIICVYDEDGTEYIQRATQIFIQLSSSVGEHCFISTLLSLLAKTQRWKLAIINCLTRYFATIKNADVLVRVSQDQLVKGIATCFSESQSILCQRIALDLVQAYMPLDSFILIHENVILLFTAIIQVVLKKDMSLNRRLYAWMLGQNDSLPSNNLDDLASVLIKMFQLQGDFKLCNKPFKIMTSLMDKVEIGHAVVPFITHDLIKSLHDKSCSNILSVDLIQSANSLLGIIGQDDVWKCLLIKVHANPNELKDNLEITLFYLTRFATLDDVAKIQLPLLLLMLVRFIVHIKNVGLITLETQKTICQTANFVLNAISLDSPLQNQTLEFDHFTDSEYNSLIDSISSVNALSRLATDSFGRIIVTLYKDVQEIIIADDEKDEISSLLVLDTFLWLRGNSIITRQQDFDPYMIQYWMKEESFFIFSKLHTYHCECMFDSINANDILLTIFEKIWNFIDTINSDKAILSFWEFSKIIQNDQLETLISNTLYGDQKLQQSALRIFGTIWVSSELSYESIPGFLTKPVFVLLGYMDSSHLAKRFQAQDWAKMHINDWSRIFAHIFQTISCTLNPIFISNHLIRGISFQLYEHGRFMNWRIVEHSMRIILLLLSSEYFKLLEMDVVLQGLLEHSPESIKFYLDGITSKRNVDALLLFTLLFISIPTDTQIMSRIQFTALKILFALLSHFRMESVSVCNSIQQIILLQLIRNADQNWSENQIFSLQILSELLRKKTFSDTGLCMNFTNCVNLNPSTEEYIEHLHATLFNIAFTKNHCGSFNWYLKRYLKYARQSETNEHCIRNLLNLFSDKFQSNCMIEDIDCVFILYSHCYFGDIQHYDSITSILSNVFDSIIQCSTESTRFNHVISKHINMIFTKIYAATPCIFINCLVKLCFNQQEMCLNKFSLVISLLNKIAKFRINSVVKTLLETMSTRIKESGHKKKIKYTHEIVSSGNILTFLQVLVRDFESSGDNDEMTHLLFSLAKDALSAPAYWKYNALATLKLCLRLASSIDKSVSVKNSYDDFIVRYFEYIITSTGKAIFVDSEGEDPLDRDLCTDVFDTISAFLTGPTFEFLDTEKSISIFAFQLVHLIFPVIKKGPTKKYFEMALDCLCKLTHLNTFRLWKKEVWEYFLEPHFFQQSPVLLSKWKHIMQIILRNEKERFNELLVRVSATPTTTLFMSKDTEVLLRVVALKRIGFFILCSDLDQLLPALPSIQEKLSEILKSQSKSMQIEAYICLSIVYSRITSKNLFNFWPSILNDMIGILKFPDDTNNDIKLSVCRFMDILQVLGIEDYEYHEWIFSSMTHQKKLSQEYTGPRRPLFTNMIDLDEAMILLQKRASVVWVDDLDFAMLDAYFLNEFSSV